ncbi:MAG: epoxyqueuosine reductase QueH [Lachnospiraceae bacterium]|nr:epoxyqueuosine reductase QueH [Lachnospiraceae bacterium]
MANSVNYQQELIRTLERDLTDNKTPSVFLHACCAPCASACLEVLDRFADITVFFYNPNITVREEYEHRLAELKRLVSLMPFKHSVSVLEGEYEPELFLKMAAGLENEPERGRRCVGCYSERLEKTAFEAAKRGFDYFATTLTLSPLKPAGVINTIGYGIGKNVLSEQDTCRYLPSDFKKNNGYLRSIELSKEYGLYRQNYCGCIYSRS